MSRMWRNNHTVFLAALQGPWCAVSASACPGYYDVMVAGMGKPMFFDYCGDVRGEPPAGPCEKR